MANKNNKNEFTKVAVQQIEETVDFSDFVNDIINFEEEVGVKQRPP